MAKVTGFLTDAALLNEISKSLSPGKAEHFLYLSFVKVGNAIPSCQITGNSIAKVLPHTEVADPSEIVTKLNNALTLGQASIVNFGYGPDDSTGLDFYDAAIKRRINNDIDMLACIFVVPKKSELAKTPCGQRVLALENKKCGVRVVEAPSVASAMAVVDKKEPSSLFQRLFSRRVKAPNGPHIVPGSMEDFINKTQVALRDALEEVKNLNFEIRQQREAADLAKKKAVEEAWLAALVAKSQEGAERDRQAEEARLAADKRRSSWGNIEHDSLAGGASAEIDFANRNDEENPLQEFFDRADREEKVVVVPLQEVDLRQQVLVADSERSLIDKPTAKREPLKRDVYKILVAGVKPDQTVVKSKWEGSVILVEYKRMGQVIQEKVKSNEMEVKESDDVQLSFVDGKVQLKINGRLERREITSIKIQTLSGQEPSLPTKLITGVELLRLREVSPAIARSDVETPEAAAPAVATSPVRLPPLPIARIPSRPGAGKRPTSTRRVRAACIH